MNRHLGGDVTALWKVLSVRHSSFVFFTESSELSFEEDITIIVVVIVVVVIPQFYEAYLKTNKVKVQTPRIQSRSRNLGMKVSKGVRWCLDPGFLRSRAVTFL